MRAETARRRRRTGLVAVLGVALIGPPSNRNPGLTKGGIRSRDLGLRTGTGIRSGVRGSFDLGQPFGPIPIRAEEERTRSSSKSHPDQTGKDCDVHQFQIEQAKDRTAMVRRTEELPLTPDRTKDPSEDGRRPGGDERRTSLAGERTVLAWWRTSLTAIAVGVGVGRLLPELAPQAINWPYAILGVAFAMYGIALFVVGTSRLGILDRHPEDELGGASRDWALVALMATGVLLGVGAMIAIVVQ